MRKLIIAANAVLAGWSSASGAAGQPEPKLFTETVMCADITDAQARLACYDRSVASLKSAYASGQLVIFDKEQVAKARRSLFGLSLPAFDLFGSKVAEPAVITEPVASARFDAGGAVTFVLRGGSIWVQTDTNPLPTAPKAGTPMTIKKNIIGSYFASFQRYNFKVHRVN